MQMALSTALALTLVAGCSAPDSVNAEVASSADPESPAPMAALSAEASPEEAGTPREDASAPLREVTDWQFDEFDGRRIETEAFRIYTTIHDDWAEDMLPDFYEAALSHYTSSIVELPRPQRKLQSFIFADRNQWQVKTVEMLPGQSDIYLRLGRGGFTTRGTAVLYDIDYWRNRLPRDTFTIAAHEGWHQYTQSAFQHNLPVWLEEGVATYMEGFRISRDDGEATFTPESNRERSRALRDALRRDRLIPLAELTRRSPQYFLSRSKDDLLTYYAQVWALTRFLAEYDGGRYHAGLQQMLLDAAHGEFIGTLLSSPYASDYPRTRLSAGSAEAGDLALKAYISPDIVALQEQYHEFVEGVVDESRSRRSRWR